MARGGDNSSSFFHVAIKCNLKNSRINGLFIDGEWQVSHTVVKNEVYDHFAPTSREQSMIEWIL